MTEKKDAMWNQTAEEGANAAPETTGAPEGEAGRPAPEAAHGEALAKAEAERDEYLRIAQRTQADFMNYKRLNVSAKSDAYDDGVRDALCALLPTLDNLDRAIEAAKAADDSPTLTEGVEMTLRQMRAAMEKLGLEEIPASGEAFDPECHDAVACTPGGEPGTVQQVFQKGYRARGRNLRCAMVRVAAE